MTLVQETGKELTPFNASKAAQPAHRLFSATEWPSVPNIAQGLQAEILEPEFLGAKASLWLCEWTMRLSKQAAFHWACPLLLYG